MMILIGGKLWLKKFVLISNPNLTLDCKKNVIGKPNGEAEWFAENLGFTQLGKINLKF